MIRERISNWEDVWSTFIVAERARPFIWGQGDCMLSVGRNVEVLTGQDFYSEHVGKYDTEIGALKYLKGLGFDHPEDMVGTYLEEIPVALAQRGDCASYQGNLGICMSGMVLFKGEETSELVPILDCIKAWKVG